MVSKERLMSILIRGRMESYIKKSPSYNPYVKSVLYDWEFRLTDDDLVFTDAYRGFNPYSGVEYVFEKGKSVPVWSCDYVGYVKENCIVSPREIYSFLKKARENHLCTCGGNLFTGHVYEDGPFIYETFFRGDIYSLLQVENLYYNNVHAARQVSAGRIRSEKAFA